MIDTLTYYAPHAACLFVGALVGMGAMAAMTVSRMADDHAQADAINEALHAAHTRCSDALETARNRIERALTCETPKAAHGVRKMAAILRGDA